MLCFASMAKYKESSANQMGLADSSMDLMKETTEVTSLGAEVGIDFSTYYIAKHYTVELEKKRLGLETYQIDAVATDHTG